MGYIEILGGISSITFLLRMGLRDERTAEISKLKPQFKCR